MSSISPPPPTFQPLPPPSLTFQPPPLPSSTFQPSPLPPSTFQPPPPSTFQPPIPPPLFQPPLPPKITETLHKTSNNKNYKKKYTLNKQYHSDVLKQQLIDLEKYWREPNNLVRKEVATNEVTHNKRRERILCFMGWCKEFSAVDEPDFTLFDINKEEYRERYQKYLDYLKKERQLNDGTMIEHLTAAIYALKMLFRYVFLSFTFFSY